MKGDVIVIQNQKQLVIQISKLKKRVGDTDSNSTNSKSKKNDIGNTEKTTKKDRAKQTLGVNRSRKPMTTRSKSKMSKKRKVDMDDDIEIDIDCEEPPKQRRRVGK